MRSFWSLISEIAIATILQLSSAFPEQALPVLPTNQSIDGRPASFEAYVDIGIQKISKAISTRLKYLNIWVIEVRIPGSSSSSSSSSSSDKTSNLIISPSSFRNVSIIAEDTTRNPKAYWRAIAPYAEDWSDPVQVSKHGVPRKSFNWLFRDQHKFKTLEAAWQLALPTSYPYYPHDWDSITLYWRQDSTQPRFRFLINGALDVSVGADTGRVHRLGSTDNDTTVFSR